MRSQRHVHHLSRLTAVCIAAGALAAPGAAARPAPLDPPPQPVETSSVVQRVDDGVDWGSAALGAGAAGAVVLVVSLGGIGYRRRHEPTAVGH